VSRGSGDLKIFVPTHVVNVSSAFYNKLRVFHISHESILDTRIELRIWVSPSRLVYNSKIDFSKPMGVGFEWVKDLL